MITLSLLRHLGKPQAVVVVVVVRKQTEHRGRVVSAPIDVGLLGFNAVWT
jgi:phenylpyruvate tautomerase PptA (4-oxalocrotonate tautomerase family)